MRETFKLRVKPSWVGIAFVLCLVAFNPFIMHVSSLDSPCIAVSFEETHLGSETGQLIYMGGGSRDFYDYLLSTNTRFSGSDVQTIYDADISPNGLWLTELQLQDGKILILARNIAGSVIFSSEPQNQYMRDVVWLGNQHFLTIVGYPRFQYYAYSIIDPFNEAIKYVHPAYVESEAHETTPLFADEIAVGSYNFSPNGRYLLTSSLVGRLYDFEEGSFLDLEKFKGQVWSYQSDHLISLENQAINSTEGETRGESVVYSYSVSQDNLREIATFTRTPDEIRELSTNSWSPNEEKIAFERWSNESLEPRRIEIFDVASKTFFDTCLRSFQLIDEFNNTLYVANTFSPNFSWSLNSRYLAVYGVLEGETDRETGSVYIYDTLENQIYEVYRGQASIVGWAQNQE